VAVQPGLMSGSGQATGVNGHILMQPQALSGQQGLVLGHRPGAQVGAGGGSEQGGSATDLQGLPGIRALGLWQSAVGSSGHVGAPSDAGGTIFLGSFGQPALQLGSLSSGRSGQQMPLQQGSPSALPHRHLFSLPQGQQPPQLAATYAVQQHELPMQQHQGSRQVLQIAQLSHQFQQLQTRQAPLTLPIPQPPL
jgi:hypothetical protein